MREKRRNSIPGNGHRYAGNTGGNRTGIQFQEIDEGGMSKYNFDAINKVKPIGIGINNIKGE